MDMCVGVLSGGGGTGNKNISLRSGFGTPTAALFFTVDNAGGSGQSTWSYGATDGTNQACAGGGFVDWIFGNTNASRHSATDKVAAYYDSTTAQFVATFSSFSADTVTINVTNDDANAIVVCVAFIVDNAYLGSQTSAGLISHGGSWTPDCAFFFGDCSPSVGVESTDAVFMFGMSDGTNHTVTAWGGETGVSATSARVYEYRSHSSCYAQQTQGSSVTYYGNCSMGSSGVTTANQSGTLNDLLFCLMLNTGGAAELKNTHDSSGGDVTISFTDTDTNAQIMMMTTGIISGFPHTGTSGWGITHTFNWQDATPADDQYGFNIWTEDRNVSNQGSNVSTFASALSCQAYGFSADNLDGSDMASGDLTMDWNSVSYNTYMGYSSMGFVTSSGVTQMALGSTTLADVALGSTSLSAVYVGSTQVWG